MSLKRTLLAATALVLPTIAQAQPVSGLYVGAGAGVNFLQETDSAIGGQAGADARAAGLPDRATIRWETGFVGVVALGYGYGNGLRTEVELSYRRNDFDNSTVAGLTSRGNSGRLEQLAGMVNVLYDINIAGFPVVPYIGGGIGIANVRSDGVRADFRPGRSQVITTEDNDDVFAFQAIAGAAFNISAVPGLALTAEYRFFGTTEPSFRGRQVQTVSNITRFQEREQENFNHSILLGIRYAFGVRPAAVVAPVAPPVAQRPEVARTYLVFFDWDRADLTDRARQIIAEAAQNSRTAGVTRLEVSGHADRSGTPQYNQRLSERRAQAVAAELERRGVSRSQMVIQAFGESRPLVPTADGVREPQNRRVEIVLR